MDGSDHVIDQLEEQMGYFRVEQEFRRIANDETPGPGNDFARGMAKAALLVLAGKDPLLALTGEDPNAEGRD